MKHVLQFNNTALNGPSTFELFLSSKNTYNVDVYIYNKHSHDRVASINLWGNFELILYIDCTWKYEDKNSSFFTVSEQVSRYNRVEGEATNQTELNAWGIHDNSVSSSHPPGTVTLTSQWKHKYLPHTYQSKREGRAGNKITVRATRQH